MADLTGQLVDDTYKDLLQVSNSNTGITSTATAVSDGEGTESTLKLSTTSVTINGLTYPTTDGTGGQFITTDAAGTLSFASASATLEGLTDTTITAAASGDYLRHNGTAWVDVTVTTLESDINHDNLTGFVANEHLDWTNETSVLYTTSSVVCGDENVDTIVIGGSTFNANFHSHADAAADFDYIAEKHTSTASASPAYVMSRSRGMSGAKTVVVTGDRLGEIAVLGHDGTDFAFGARIQFVSTGTVGANTIPTNILFNVAPDGGGPPATAVTINEDKNVDFANGIDVTGAIGVTSTVDGRDIATDGTKLDGIESGATGDQTDEEIQDIAGPLVATGGTKTGITVTYQDATADMDFLVDVTPSSTTTLTNKTINTASNTITVVEADISDLGTYETADADILKADTADVLTAGFAHTDHSAGTKSSGTFTPDEANGNFQTATNGGAHTLAPPSNSCNVIVQYTNNGSAGAITTSGFTIVTGDVFTTTNGHDFLCYLTKVSTFSHLNVVALQ